MTLKEFIEQNVEIGTAEAYQKMLLGIGPLILYCGFRCRGIFAINPEDIAICEKHRAEIFNKDMKELYGEDFIDYIGL